MDTVKILIVEDELIIAEDMRFKLERLGYEVIGIAANYAEGLDLLSTTSPDIALVDISLGGDKDGIDLAIVVRDKFQIPLIFITSHADRSTVDRAKEAKPNGYLVKPFEADDLYTSIEVALCNYSGINNQVAAQAEPAEQPGLLIRDSIYIKEGRVFTKVNIDALRWIKSDANYLELHTPDKRHVVRSSLRDFIEKLPGNRFFRVHKSYAVNLDYIDAINNLHLVVGETSIPIGRNFRDLLLKRVQTA